MGEHSASNKVTAAFVEEYVKKFPQDTVKTINLATKNLPAFTAKRVQAKFATWGGKEEPEGSQDEWNITKDLIDEFLKADKYVFASPMWNLGIANQMKLYFDHIVQPWKTFNPTKMPGGLVIGKPALIIAASGSDLLGTPYDFTSSYLKVILSFIGFTDIRSIFVSGTADQQKAPSLLSAAIAEAKSLVPQFHFNINGSFDFPKPLPEPEIIERNPIGKRVLAIVSSPMGQFSASTTVLNHFLDEYKRKVPDAVVNIFDIFQRNLLPFNAERVQAKFATWGGKELQPNLEESWSFTKELIEEFKWADTYVFAVPMWNLGIPNQLKLYLDHIVQPWKTFDPTKQPGGLITGKPCFLICSAGGPTLGTPFDYVTPYLSAILGYIGITDIRKVWINNTVIDTKKAIEEGISNAKLLLDQAVTNVEASPKNESMIESKHFHVLVITSSPMGNHSASNKVADAFIEEYKAKNPDHLIKIIDLSTKNLPAFTAKRVQAKFATWGGKEEPEGSQDEWNITKDLIDEFLKADKYVFASPMWNLGIPNQLKLYFDHIIQPWKTFNPTKMPGGLVTEKPALIIAASGSDLLGTPYDFTSSYLKAILSFIGFTDIRSIFVSGTADQLSALSLIENAIEKVKKEIVPNFQFNEKASVDLPNNFQEISSPVVEGNPIGKRVLAIVSSPMGQFSASTTVLNHFLDEYKRKVPDAVVNIFDVFQRQLLPYNAERVQAKFATYSGKEVPSNLEESWSFTKELIEEFKWADTYVFAVPMWNLGIPNQLKLYLDHIVQPWKTFDPTKYPGGLITGKPCFLICSAGGPTLGTPFDYVTPYLSAILGYIGITDIRKVWINNTAVVDSSAVKDLIEEKTVEALKLLEDSYTTFTPFSSIEKVLKTYEETLNAKDTSKLSSLYSEGARLTINNYGSADSIGIDQITEAFREFLEENNTSKIYLEIIDIVEYSNFAHASAVVRCIRNKNSYRENFVLEKDSTWKITLHTTNIKFAN